MEKIDFSHPPEFYKDLHDDKVMNALGWMENDDAVRVVKIDEDGLEAHIEKKWKKNDRAYHAEIEDWRGYGPLNTLTRIESKSGSGYIVDTNDLIIGKPEDEFLFYQLGSCWGIIIDMDYEGREKRTAFHMGGVTPNKKVSMKELLKVLKSVGAEAKTINVFYSQTNYNTSSESNTEDTSFINETEIENIPVNFVNLESLALWGSYDVIIKNDSARQYHNKGMEPDWKEQEERVDRIFDGIWKLE